MHDYPMIALVGRPNVGKSTLFNRLIGRREAITSHVAGTTRDRHFGVMEWYRNSWTVIDTAGIIFDDEIEASEANLQDAMEEQVEVAVAEADVIAVVFDVKQGITPQDQQLLNMLRKHNKPIVILANKADNAAFRDQAQALRAFGIHDVFPVSAIHGSGLNDFTDYLLEHFPSPSDDQKDRLPRLTIIGRPNVGKSSLTNRLLGEKRMVVSATPGTTRDSITTELALPNGKTYLLVDTAGIRRRGQIEAGIERFSLFRTLRAINMSDIVILALTIEESPTRNDAHVATYALEANKKVILALNKADLAAESIVRLTEKQRQSLGQRFLRRFPFLQRLPWVFVSAETGDGINDLMGLIEQVLEANEAESR